MTADCHICRAVERAWADGNCQGLYVLPSTTGTLSGCERWLASDSTLAVIGREAPHAMTPLQWLAGKTTADAPAVVFSDQLVCEEDAPLLVTHLGASQFMPVVEAIASTRHGRPLHVWTGEGVEALPAGSDTRAVLRLLLRYLHACADLGPEWRMRDAQVQRLLEVRARTAARRLRLFKSAVLHTFRDGALPVQQRESLRALGASHRALQF